MAQYANLPVWLSAAAAVNVCIIWSKFPSAVVPNSANDPPPVQYPQPGHCVSDKIYLTIGLVSQQKSVSAPLQFAYVRAVGEADFWFGKSIVALGRNGWLL